MDYVVNPAPLTGGKYAVPGDKSISHRALMLSAIADGESVVSGFLQGEDCKATVAALRALGVKIDAPDTTTLAIQGAGMRGLKASAAPLDLGNSGTGMRLFAGLLCGQDFPSRLIGDASLTRRPMARVIEPLTRMGADIDSNGGLPPLTIRGGRALAGIHYALPVASAQVKSAILLAALYADGDTTVIEPAPTRDHTERMLQSLGVTLQGDGRRISVRGRQIVKAANIEVPGDLSSAAFVIVAGLIAPDCEVLLERVGMNPSRSGVIDILREMGASIDVENTGLLGFEPVADLRVRSSALAAIDVDPSLVSLAIDEFPVLFVAAAAAQGRTRFTGIGELRVKESDRISAMAEGLRQLGIAVDEFEDGADVHGGVLKGGAVESHGDHRVAMSLAVAGTIAASPVRIRHADNVDTSFPGFIDGMRFLGADVTTSRTVPTP